MTPSLPRLPLGLTLATPLPPPALLPSPSAPAPSRTDHPCRSARLDPSPFHALLPLLIPVFSSTPDDGVAGRRWRWRSCGGSSSPARRGAAGAARVRDRSGAAGCGWSSRGRHMRRRSSCRQRPWRKRGHGGRDHGGPEVEDITEELDSAHVASICFKCFRCSKTCCNCFM